MAEIVLCTLNARYIHASFGLRYLKANLGELSAQCEIQEFTLDARPEDVVELILASNPKIVGFGVYIWNVVQTEKVVSLLKVVAPDVIVVLGGPEVSYEYESQPIVVACDYLITGWGETSFASLARDLLSGRSRSAKVIQGEQPKLDAITMPYHLYSDDDIQHRLLYVEASRGCPFKCEFCLSALDKTAWPFDLDEFLLQMALLYERGARHFKFVDRTFNLKIKNSLRILQFFLDRMGDDLFLHFEVIPDHLPEALKSMIQQFPAGSLQFEIGIQTFNPEVQSLISRRQDNDKAKQNLAWIRQHTNAYIHADLIFGLPGEDRGSFARSFDALYALRPHEIQVGILKRLKGSPIIRHTESHELRFNPNPPYSIVANRDISFDDVQTMARFARYWGLIGNSGRFTHSLPLILDVSSSPFERFLMLADAIFELTGQTHKISLLRLFDLVFDIAVSRLSVDAEALKANITLDHRESGLKSIPKCLTGDNITHKSGYSEHQPRRSNSTRQARHR
ncbi:B12-binding domain-containing radical SAM protein [Arenicella chitinivorans]|uniref:B12-binding domain-containing radical SAM protein n=2 Tax=Arenicella chitinivorans TaxID=1329800 RepID=A0A918VIE3_9GAMM|nr:B12-binding domain-containing radical SAM protein [Arenicella chitinivorans]